MFSLFGKLQSTSKISQSGIGLGLNICKRICESFDGNISVKSKLGEGTTLTFVFKIIDVRN
jgi:signal transduction histidine kinase